MSRDIPAELVDQLMLGNVLILLGDSIHIDPAHATDLIDDLATQCGYPIGHQRTLPHVAYYYERRLGRQHLISFLRERLWDYVAPLPEIYQLIARLPVPIIVTTSHDNLIERAFQALAIPHTIVIQDADVAYTERQKRLLIWVFGRLDLPESLVLTEPEQLGYMDQSRNLSDLLRAELALRTWLILGFDVGQPWFRAFYAHVIRRLDHHGHPAHLYGYMPEGPIADWCEEHHVVAHSIDVRTLLRELNDLVISPHGDHPVDEPLPDFPYRRLDAFRGQDRRIFFGRERELLRLTDLLRAERLVLLYGPSGTGKTSLVQAGVIPLLLREPQSWTPIITRVLNNPLETVRSAIAVAGSSALLSPSAQIPELLRAIADQRRSKILLVIDQFEELFVPPNRDLREVFLHELALALTARAIPVKVLLIIREEWLAALDELTMHLTNVEGARYRLLPLGREAAREAIVQPASMFGVQFEHSLVELLLDQLSDDQTLPLQLQLVCDALYRDLKPGQNTLTLARYIELGYADAILRRFMQDSLASMSGPQRALAHRILEELVSMQGTKIAKRPADLAVALSVGEQTLVPVLQLLAGRLLRVVVRPEREPLYELAHDHLVKEIRISPETLARKIVEEQLERGPANWEQLGLLLSPEVVVLAESQHQRLLLRANALELLIRSAVQHRRATVIWTELLTPTDRAAFIQRLQDDLTNTNQARRNLANNVLQRMGHFLQPSLYIRVYSQYLITQTMRIIRSVSVGLLLLVVLLLVMLWLITPVTVPWTPVALPTPIATNALTVAVSSSNPDLIYLSDHTPGGLYKRDTAGVPWSQVHSPWLTDTITHNIAPTQLAVYISTDRGIFVSTDAGNVWQPVPPPLPETEKNPPPIIAAHPLNTQELYAVISNAGFFVTDNGGLSWSHIPVPLLAGQAFTAMATDGHTLVVASDREIWIHQGTKLAEGWRRYEPSRQLPLPITALAFGPSGSRDRFFIGLGADGRDGVGIGDADVTSSFWLALVNGPEPGITTIAISGEAWYAGTAQSLLCRRRWFAHEGNWWRAKLGMQIPCAL